MPIINWSPHFSIGLEHIDEHHQHLFFLLNRLFDDFVSQEPEQDIGLLIDELIDYATYHFAAEEQWMRDVNFPKMAQHEQEHTEFSNKIVSLSKRYNGNGNKGPLELLTFLHNWLAAHILQSDAELGRFMESLYRDRASIDQFLSVEHENGARRTGWKE